MMSGFFAAYACISSVKLRSKQIAKPSRPKSVSATTGSEPGTMGNPGVSISAVTGKHWS